jgi:hypothetical protein
MHGQFVEGLNEEHHNERETSGDTRGEKRVDNRIAIRPLSSRSSPRRSSARVSPSEAQSKGALSSVSKHKKSSEAPACASTQLFRDESDMSC